MGIMNGRRIDPNSIPNGVHGSELVRIANPGPGWVPVVECGGKVQQADPRRQYSRAELGRPPEPRCESDHDAEALQRRVRRGGHANPNRSSPNRSPTSPQKTIFQRQGVDFDRKDANWLVVPTYNLPPRWHRIARSTALMAVLPDEYPALPPVGFYMMADIPIHRMATSSGGVAHTAWVSRSQPWLEVVLRLHGQRCLAARPALA